MANLVERHFPDCPAGMSRRIWPPGFHGSYLPWYLPASYSFQNAAPDPSAGPRQSVEIASNVVILRSPVIPFSTLPGRWMPLSFMPPNGVKSLS